MSIWYKVKWIQPLFDAFNQRFPGRGKASDGSIGDFEHTKTKSGHNPDDTAGSKPEREDADSKPEVRAADVTSALPGVSMWDVVQAVLLGPRDELDRLIYIICNGYIWQKANGWRMEKYYGDDQHFGHAHFSGDPASDEDGRPWTAVLNFGQLEPAYMEDEDAMGASYPPIEIKQYDADARVAVTSLSIAPVEGGTADPRPAWLNVGNDTFGEIYALRVWYSTGDGNFAPLEAGSNKSGNFVLKSGERLSVSLPVGTSILTIQRLAVKAGKAVPVDKDNVAYLGNLTCSIERGPVK